MALSKVALVSCHAIGAVIVLTSVWALAVHELSRWQMTSLKEADFRDVFPYATCIIATALLFEVSTVLSAKFAGTEKRAVKDFAQTRMADARHMVVILSSLCAAYLAMSTGWCPFTMTDGGERPVCTLHYVAWGLSLPLLLKLMSGGTPGTAAEASKSLPLPTFGLEAGLLASWLAVVVGPSGTRQLLVVLGLLAGSLGMLARILAASNSRIFALAAVQGVLFSLYVLVYLLGLSQAVTPWTERVLFVMLDVVTVLSHSIALNIARQMDDLTEAQGFRTAVIFHELRSPLHGITGLSEVLAKDEKDAQRAKRLRTIKNCASRLLNLVENVMSADPNMDRPLSLGLVNVSEVIEEVVCLVGNATDKLGGPLLQKGVKLLTRTSEDVPIIEADANRCTQLFYNILSNACKFTSEGEISISSKMEESHDFVQVVVSDTGKGIAPEFFSRIFQPFEREHGPDTARVGGVGLGLHIAREVAHQHGGNVTVKSQLGAGTTFTVRLPVHVEGRGNVVYESERRDLVRNQHYSQEDPISLAGTTPYEHRSQKADSDMDSTRSMKGMGPETVPEVAIERIAPRLSLPCRSRSNSSKKLGSKPLILSVDDDPVNQTIIDMSLHDQYDIHMAMDGQECLDYFTTHSKLPDVVLLDAKMPGLSGFEVCSCLRNDYGFPPTVLPILMLSASAEQSAVTEGLNAGCNDYVSKPFDPEVLQARVCNALQIKRLHSIEMENAKHTELLHSIMPPHIVERLTGGEHMVSESHTSVTILFSDIVGWTNIAESLSTSQVVILLNDLFSAFDQLTEEHKVFKVETIGDAYMCAAGHDGSADHAERIVKFGLAMVAAAKSVRIPGAGLQLQIRVGAHTGPAYTGVVGKKVPRYCFFGDTVNVSSRMESHGSPGCIHISGSTREKLPMADHFFGPGVQIIDRGCIDIKGKGSMTTHLVLPAGGSTPSKHSRRSSVCSKNFQSDKDSDATSPVPEAAAKETERLLESLKTAEERRDQLAKRVEELERRPQDAEELKSTMSKLESARAASEHNCKTLQAEVHSLRAQLEASVESRGLVDASPCVSAKRGAGREEVDAIGLRHSDQKSQASTTDSRSEGRFEGLSLVQMLASKEQELEHVRVELQVRTHHLQNAKEALIAKTAELEAKEVELAIVKVDLRQASSPFSARER